MREDVRTGAHELEQGAREPEAEHADGHGHQHAERNRLNGRAGRALEVAFAHAPRDGRHGADAQPDGDCVDDGEHRLGEADGGDRVRSETRDEEHVDDREH